jgi:hypothetical protein
LQDIIGVRPFATKRPDVTGQGAYGINGPPVTISPTTNEQQTATPVSGLALPNTDRSMAASEPTALAVERVPALKSNGTPRSDIQLGDENDENVDTSNPPPTDNQPLTEEKNKFTNPPTSPAETKTTQGTTPAELAANSVPPKLRGPFRSNLSLKDKQTPSSESLLNHAFTATTSATTGAGVPTGDGSRPHGGSPSEEGSRSASLSPDETSGRTDRTGVM